MRVGRHWSDVIDRESLAAIRREQLNPPLSAGDVTGGVVAALQAVEERLAVARASGVPWTIVGPVLASLAVVAVAVAWFWRRHQRLAWERQRLARAAERLMAARRAVADAAAEARSTVEGATRLKPGHQQEYQGRLRRLDQRRARLEEQTPSPAALPDELVALTTAYRNLTDAVRFSLASLTMTASELKNRQRRRARPPAGSRYTAATGSAASEPADNSPSSYSSDSSPSSSGGGESRDGGEY
jgi:uncharacterized membrane protein YgcG